MIISVVGVVETKYLVLMLSRGLSVENKVLIVTNDIAYKRIGIAVDGDEYLRRIENVDILVDMLLEGSNSISDNDINEIASSVANRTFERYSAVIVSTSDTFIDGADCKVYCEGTDSKSRTSMVTNVINNYSKMVAEVDNESDIDVKEKVIEIVISSKAGSVKDKTKGIMNIDANTVLQLMNIEEKHQIEIFKNKTIMSCICKHIAPVIGFKSSKMEKMIKRKRTIVSKSDIE